MSRPFPLPSRRPSAVPQALASGQWTGSSRLSNPPRASRAPARLPQESGEIERPGAAEVVIDYAVPGCVIAHLRNLTFCAWNTMPTAEHVEAFMAMAQQLSEIYPKNSNVSLVLRESELPGGKARGALETLVAQYASYLHSVALVIDGDGFWASMVRSFLTGLHLLRGNDYRCKAFASTADAIPWLLPAHNAETGVSITARELEAACEAIYRRMQLEGRPGG
jgi:hypothetical protein